ncbi:hypothetical protein BS50DRAFT_554951 [Corynespora cassiicola Philippines]|uniref:25S rRNA (Uridine(2843)-N(3))-methyltransferase n=1 Tax=Corynespora cassiicola Philippines TaxID=1448308 RepID=A0A2T2NMA0_CORCC|nr:hypothetical protein BS50DRAFT_554951 [Corynespora cassiicola Philippines]
MAPQKQSYKNNKKADTKSAKKAVQEDASNLQASPSVPIEVQQLLLDIFKNTFSERLSSDVQPLLQEIKGHLFNRDFPTAFGKGAYLEAYAARWSPSRALGYLQVLNNLKDQITTSPGISADTSNERRKIVCLGGGAGAEIVALGGFAKMARHIDMEDERTRKLEVVAIDMANWTNVVGRLADGLLTAPPLSKYASAIAQATNAPLLSGDEFGVTFHQHDILNTDIVTLKPLLEGSGLVTIMFTLNELYSTSISLTQRFLFVLTTCLQPGALLLVVDSPGSYSSISLNGTERKYPMQWLLDHTLLKQGTKDEDPAWEKIQEDESQWFRLPHELKYPIELENMRFQLHLYRRHNVKIE